MTQIDIGIDLGTANTKIFVKNEGLVLNVPSVVALKKSSGKFLEIGNKAYEMIGKNPSSIEVKFPLRNGAVVDYEFVKVFIEELLKLVIKKSVKKSRICFVVHSSATGLERLVFPNLVSSCGDSDVFFIEEPVASGIGAGINLSNSRNALVVVNIGGGTVDLALLSFEGILLSRSYKIGGQEIDGEIIDNIVKKYGLIIGKSTAEKTKIRALTLNSPNCNKNYKLKGKDKWTGLPKSITLNQKQICGLITLSLTKIVTIIEDFVMDIPREFSQNVVEGGVILTGGGCLIEGFADFITKKIGIKAKLASNPISCAVCGIGHSFEKIPEFEAGFIIPA